jgi:ribosomal protein S9
VITFNGRGVEEYLGNNPFYVASVRDPLEVLGLENTYDVIVKARGGGVMGQAEAARLGISRALVKSDESHRPELKAEGFMTRDPRWCAVFVVCSRAARGSPRGRRLLRAASSARSMACIKRARCGARGACYDADASLTLGFPVLQAPQFSKR